MNRVLAVLAVAGLAATAAGQTEMSWHTVDGGGVVMTGGGGV